MSHTARIVAARDLSESERQAKREIMPLLEYDRVQLMLAQPFLGSLAMRLELVPVVDCRLRTAATDGKHLFFNAEFMHELDPATRRFIMAHEVWHCAALHIPRRGTRERLHWNLAIDHETNHVLGQQGLEIPKGAVHYPEHAGDNAETVYAALQSNRQLQRSRGALADQHDPASDQGLPATGPIDPDFQPLQGAEVWEQWPRRVTIAAQQMRYLYGHHPGWLKQLLSLVGEPAIAWQELLRRFIERSHTSEYRWTRPNRRFLTQGLILPGRHSEHLSLAVGIDVSGSTLDDLPRFLAELKGILTSFARWTLHLVACDTRIVFDQVYSDDNPPPDDLPISVGGGTRLQPVIDVLADQPPSALVFLTDGYAPEPSQPDFPVLWAVSDQGQRPAPWGELIRLSPPS